MSRRRTQMSPQDLHETAAAWFARQRSGAMTDNDRAFLREWLQSDPAHAAAYADVRRGWGSAGSVRSDPRVLAMRERWDGLEPRRYWHASRALAASLLVALVLAGAFAGWRNWAAPGTLGDQMYRTAVGEQRTIELADGSLVTLNTNTVLRTRRDDERRLLYLDEGQAYFEVARNPDRPFVVTAAGRTVTALGTAFDVRVADGEFKVTLVEGKVRVEALVASLPSPDVGPVPKAATREPVVQATEMVAGTQLVAPANEDWRIVRPNLLAETSWTKGRLIFNSRRLAEVVEEMNRYSGRKIVIGDPRLADIPVSGTFKPGDIGNFVAALEDYEMARRGRGTDQTVELLPF